MQEVGVRQLEVHGIQMLKGVLSLCIFTHFSTALLIDFHAETAGDEKALQEVHADQVLEDHAPEKQAADKKAGKF